jgi:transposase
MAELVFAFAGGSFRRVLIGGADAIGRNVHIVRLSNKKFLWPNVLCICLK